MVSLEYRQSRPQEWEQARDLRREMLADTPIAYLEPLSHALATTDEVWQRRHEDRHENPSLSALFVAVDEHGRWRGQAATMVNIFSDPRRVWLGAVFVSPEARGSGAGERLVELAEEWARAAGFTDIWLEVHEDNARAIRFYERTGWVLTGARRAYPLDSTRDEVEMRKAL